ncbi:MAG: ABC transporter permease [Sedimentisphaerales bacterium]|nr:ABC transporter permease [Sedimentisphaerales bacterium]
MTAIVSDLKYAVRQLRRDFGFAIAALSTLAICMAANVVIFAVTDAILFRSLPFPQADRLVIAFHNYPGAGVEHQACSLTSCYEWRRELAALASIAATQPGSVVINNVAEREPERVFCERVTPGFFEMLGVTPALGRFFTEEESELASNDVVVLTDAYWRSRCDADPGVLGSDIQVDGRIMIIVGVLRPDFRYLSSHAKLFFPLASAPQDRGPSQRHNTNAQVIGRLAPGVSLPAAQAQIDALNARQMKDEPRLAKLLEGTGFHTRLYPLHADHVRSARPVLLLLQGGALLLLVIGGVNLINLLLIRASGRVKEFSIRQTLGASRRCVVRDVLVETVLLAGVGGVLGLIAGAFGMSLLSALGTSELPLGEHVTFGYRVAATALFGAVLVGLVAALPIIGFHLRKRPALTLQVEGRSSTVSRAAQRWRHGFVVAQIALAFLLLTGAGLLSISLKRVLDVTPGFRPEHVLTGRIGLPPAGYGNESARLAFVERLLNELRAQPGVTSAAISTVVPFTGQDNSQAIVAEGVVPQGGDSLRAHFHCATSDDFWQTLGIPLREGRLLEDADNHREERVCLVDEAFSRRYWPNGGAIGYRVTKGPVFDEATAFTIVGIVGQVKQDRLEETALGAVYFPYRYDAIGNVYVIARSSLTPAVMTSTLRRTVARLDPEIPVDDVHTMQARIDASLAQRRSPALLAGVFASIALLLTGLGTYGVTAYAVAQRRREIGVRMALGARPRQVLAQFLGAGAKLLLAGVALGAGGAWVAGRAMESLLYGVSVVHVGVWATAIGVMLSVVLLACYVPARRAAKIDPMVALRCE